jgi:hypothetical protein
VFLRAIPSAPTGFLAGVLMAQGTRSGQDQNPVRHAGVGRRRKQGLRRYCASRTTAEGESSDLIPAAPDLTDSGGSTDRATARSLRHEERVPQS